MSYELAGRPVLAMGLLQIDGTVAIQLFIFLVLLYVLDRILFQPILSSMRIRKEILDSQRAEARGLRLEADHCKARHEEALDLARSKAAKLRRHIVEEGHARAELLLREVRELGGHEIARAEAELDRTANEMRSRLDMEAHGLAREIVHRVLRTDTRGTSDTSGTSGKVVLLVILGCILLAGVQGTQAAASETSSRTAKAAVEASVAAAAAQPDHEVGDAHQAAGAHGWTGRAWFEFGGTLVNFILLVWVLRRFARKPLQKALAERRARAERELEEAALLREASAQVLQEAEIRLKKLEDDSSRILEELRRAGEKERDRILAEAEEAAARIRGDTEARIRKERRRVELELKTELVSDALRIAEEQLREQLTPDEDQRQIERFICLLGSVVARTAGALDDGPDERVRS